MEKKNGGESRKRGEFLTFIYEQIRISSVSWLFSARNFEIQRVVITRILAYVANNNWLLIRHVD